MVPEAAPLSPASSLPQSFLLKCLEQVRKIQADGAELQERLVSEGGRQRRVREGTEVLQEGAQRRGWGRRRRRDPWERMPPDWERRDWGVMDWQGEVEPWALAQSWGRGRTSWGQCWEGLAAEWTEEGEQEAWWEVEGGKDLREMGALGREDSPALSAPLTRHPSRPQCATHKLCHPQELVLLGHSLGLPQASLSSCSSQALQLTGCLNQLHGGLVLYQGLLQALAGISPELAPALDILQLDVTDLATNIWLQVSLSGSSKHWGPGPRWSSKAVLPARGSRGSLGLGQEPCRAGRGRGRWRYGATSPSQDPPPFPLVGGVNQFTGP
uniref:Granulocyte colony-stimulating factor n=1 Tax=Sus scrofa TaxID=9823 RepID=A0A8D1JCY2_PIG